MFPRGQAPSEDKSQEAARNPNRRLGGTPAGLRIRSIHFSRSVVSDSFVTP